MTKDHLNVAITLQLTALYDTPSTFFNLSTHYLTEVRGLTNNKKGHESPLHFFCVEEAKKGFFIVIYVFTALLTHVDSIFKHYSFSIEFNLTLK